MAARDLEQLDLAYAPPFSSARDPAMMAGMLDGGGQLTDDMLLLDVRTREEYAHGAIAGSVNIPVDELRSRLQELPSPGPKGGPVVVYCRSGYRSYQAARMMAQRGAFGTIFNLGGGYLSWLDEQDAAGWARPGTGEAQGR